MSTLRNISMSLIEYRPSLFQRAAPVPLGIVLSASLGRLQLVVLTAKKELTEEDAKRLDPVSVELLAKPFSYLKEQLTAALAGTKSPDEGLSNFSAANQWSLYVSAPRPRELHPTVLDFSKALTLRRVIRDAYRFHQAGMDPFATTVHKTSKRAHESGGDVQIQRLDPNRHVWQSRGGALRLAIGA